MGIRTIVLTPGLPVVRQQITRTNVGQFEDAHVMHLFNAAQRPSYSFDLEVEPMYRGAAEELSAFHNLHQGARSFFYDGGPYATVENFQLFAEGDGTTRQFYLPNRWIGGAGSFSIQTKNQATSTTSAWATTAYSLNATPGLVTFNSSTNTTPNSGHDILAKYSCKYRVVFDPNGFRMEELARNVYRAQIKLTEVFIFTA